MAEPAPHKYNLLLVDDDPFILEGIGEDLEQRGYRVTRVNSGDKAVDAPAADRLRPGDYGPRHGARRRHSGAEEDRRRSTRRSW